MRRLLYLMLALLVSSSAMADSWIPDVPTNLREYRVTAPNSTLTGDATLDGNNCLAMSELDEVYSNASGLTCSNSTSYAYQLFPYDIYITRFNFIAKATYNNPDSCKWQLATAHGLTTIGPVLNIPPTGTALTSMSLGDVVSLDIGYLLAAGQKLEILQGVGSNLWSGGAGPGACSGGFGAYLLNIEYTRGPTVEGVE